MKKLEKVLKVFANARRLAILAYLRQTKEASVGNIAREIKLSFKSTSRHLGVLFAADLVEKDQRSLEVYYYLSHPAKKMLALILTIL